MSTNGKQKARVTTNAGDGLTPEDRAAVRDMIFNAVTSRSEFIRQYMDPRRDLYKECGYPNTASIMVDNYRELYDRESIAARVVEVLPKETWLSTPTVYESEDSDQVTPFEQAWDDLGKSLRGESFYQDEKGNPIWEMLERVDKLSGIGHFGVLLLGIDDGKELADPIEGFKDKDGLAQRLEQESAESGAMDGFSPLLLNEGILDIGLSLNELPNLESDEDDESEETPEEGKDEVSEEDSPEGIESDEPIESVKVETKRKLLYMRAFDESLVQVVEYESEKTNPRFGQPKRYLLTLNDPTDSHGGTGLPLSTVEVHWSRVIHVADNLGSSEVFGVPRMRPVYNHLQALNKLYHGSAEMYWRGAFPGLSFESHPQLAGDISLDIAGTKVEAEKYMNSLQRYIVSEGLTVKTLSPVVVDPSTQIETHITAICVLLGIPQRIFMGSERGELASGQDDGTWKGRLSHRQKLYLTPRLIVPFVDRLIQIGVLPKPVGFSVSWPEMETLDDVTKAQVALTKTQAMAAYVAGGVDVICPPQDYLTYIVGMTEEEATAILENSVDRMAEAPENDPLLAKQEADKEHELEQAELAHEQGLEQMDKDIEGKKEIEKSKPKPKPTGNSWFGRQIIQP